MWLSNIPKHVNVLLEVRGGKYFGIQINSNDPFLRLHHNKLSASLLYLVNSCSLWSSELWERIWGWLGCADLWGCLEVGLWSAGLLRGTCYGRHNHLTGGQVCAMRGRRVGDLVGHQLNFTVGLRRSKIEKYLKRNFGGWTCSSHLKHNHSTRCEIPFLVAQAYLFVRNLLLRFT